ncbi:COX15/CtaA family protein [Bacillus testis]|uniref:COX15/CtaA family protein n=1 Tax=Bacillus testis TaxID=1622072 RepID=UPI00067F58A0|nr:heme A synthase [Bacillus testis]
MHRALKRFAVLTTIGMLLILLGGALVTKTDSGMGCGRSWPLCDGQIIPADITKEMVIEWSHRSVSGAVGLMVLILSFWSWKKIGHVRETKFLAILSISFLILQGLIGAAAVLWGQSDFILALHFGISLISFAAVFLLTLLIFEVDKKFDTDKLSMDRRMTFHTTGILLYIYFVVYTGALVRHSKSSLSCADWPLCRNDGSFMPENTFEWIQMGHRMLAGLAFIWVAYATLLAIKNYRHQKAILYGWIASFVLICLQVIAGAFIIFTRLNLFVALSHAFFISCLFGVLSYMLLLASRSKRNKAVASEHSISANKLAPNENIS